MRDPGYDPVRDFAPVTLTSIAPLVLMVRADFPARTVAEFVTEAKARGGALNYGIGNIGSLAAAQLLISITGISAERISYRGTPAAVTDLLAGRVHFMVSDLASAGEHVRAGTLRALGVTTKTRAASFPEIPTIDETLPGYETYTWNALFAPKGTPPEVIEVLHKAAVEAMEDPAVIARMADFSAEIVAGTPEELAAHVAAEAAKWAPVVEEAGVRMD